MIKLFDTVKVKKSGALASVLEIEDDGGKKPPVYLLELVEKPSGAEPDEVVFWCDYSEVEASDK